MVGAGLMRAGVEEDEWIIPQRTLCRAKVLRLSLRPETRNSKPATGLTTEDTECTEPGSPEPNQPQRTLRGRRAEEYMGTQLFLFSAISAFLAVNPFWTSVGSAASVVSVAVLSPNSTRPETRCCDPIRLVAGGSRPVLHSRRGIGRGWRERDGNREPRHRRIVDRRQWRLCPGGWCSGTRRTARK